MIYVKHLFTGAEKIKNISKAMKRITEQRIQRKIFLWIEMKTKETSLDPERGGSRCPVNKRNLTPVKGILTHKTGKTHWIFSVVFWKSTCQGKFPSHILSEGIPLLQLVFQLLGSCLLFITMADLSMMLTIMSSVSGVLLLL